MYRKDCWITCRFDSMFDLMKFVIKSEPINFQSFHVESNDSYRVYDFRCFRSLEQFVEDELFPLTYKRGPISFMNVYEVLFTVSCTSYEVDEPNSMTIHDLISSVQCELRISSISNPYSLFMYSIHFTEHDFLASQTLWRTYDNEYAFKEYVNENINNSYRVFKFYDSQYEVLEFYCSLLDLTSYFIDTLTTNGQPTYMVIRIGSYLDPLIARNLLFNPVVSEIKQDAYRENVKTYFNSGEEELRNSLKVCRLTKLSGELKRDTIPLNEKSEEGEYE